MPRTVRTNRWVAVLLAGLSLTGRVAAQAVPPSPYGVLAPAPPPAAEQPSVRDVPPPLNPPFLNRSLEGRPEEPAPAPAAAPEPLLQTPVNPPLGFTGPSSVVPREVQQSSDVVTVEDRWRGGFSAWDRYGRGHPTGEDYPYTPGHWWDPYNQSVLKGDYPVFGQNTFLNVTASSQAILEERAVPTATTPFESTARPGEKEFFNRPDQFFYTNFFSLSFDLSHGDAAFKPADWRIHVTPIFNVNYLAVEELGVVSPDVRKGTTRGRDFLALQEWFVETKLADLSPDYDFVSARLGSQPFTSDFRGFIFSDVNRAARLFGTRFANRDQFNVVYFRQQEKDTNSMLNTFRDRQQDILIANYYRQDFIFPGYTAQASVHYNHDAPTFHFDQNGFLVRPDPVGAFRPHELNVCYLGWTGDGHINEVNVTHAFYWALGHDSRNPLANCPQDVNAQMAAVELSLDRDWMRFRTSFFYASGDGNIDNGHATGFDTILDNPNFAGGRLSYWQRQTIKLFGVNLTQRESLVPNLRSSKIQGQSNFVNPGLVLVNGGVDFELTPKLRSINNVNYLWFDKTDVLRQFVFQDVVRRQIGADLSSGLEYRPLLNNNVILNFGVSMLIPGEGFRDLFNPLIGRVGPQLASFLELTLAY